LPDRAHPAGRHCRPGKDLIAGRRVWDVQSKFRLQLGPLTAAQFRRFLPSGDALRPLGQMTRSYVGPEFDFDVQVVLLAAEVPRWRLGGAEGPDAARLGWNTWARCRPFERDVSDACF